MSFVIEFKASVCVYINDKWGCFLQVMQESKFTVVKVQTTPPPSPPVPLPPPPLSPLQVYHCLGSSHIVASSRTRDYSQ